MPLESFSPGDEVVLLPSLDSPSERTIAIAEVANVDGYTLQLTDGRMYSLQHRWGLTPRSQGYFVRATEEHHRALRSG